LLRDDVAATSQGMRRTTPHAILGMRRAIAAWAIIRIGIQQRRSAEKADDQRAVPLARWKNHVWMRTWRVCKLDVFNQPLETAAARALDTPVNKACAAADATSPTTCEPLSLLSERNGGAVGAWFERCCTQQLVPQQLASGVPQQQAARAGVATDCVRGSIVCDGPAQTDDPPMLTASMAIMTVRKCRIFRCIMDRKPGSNSH